MLGGVCMNKNRKKQIKKLKKIHIIPHIISLTVFIAIFAVITFALVEVFLSFLIENHLEESYERAKKFANYVEKQSRENIETKVNGWTTDDFGVYDNVNNEFIIQPNREIDLNSFITYEFDNRKVYFDKVEDNGLGFISSEKNVNEYAIVSYLIRSIDRKIATDSVALNDDLFYFHGWIDEPIKNGDYSVYYSTDLNIKVKDVLYIVIFVCAMSFVVLVPLLFYIVTLTISIIGQRRSSRLIFYDNVTGGRNWLYFKDQVEKLKKRNKSRKRKYAMVSFRMDRYQSYCSCYGTAEGEVVIEQINAVLAKSVNKRLEAFARYSEAEFGMLLLMDSREQLVSRIDNIKAQLIKLLEPRKVDFSVGLYEIVPGDKADELYSNASIARKNIPSNASEKYFWFDEKMREDQLWERYVEENMENALNSGELHVYLQPKYNATTQKLGGAEALIRWISPTKGFIGPGKFIPIFEKNGFITKIDDFMLSSVAKLQAQWVKEGKNVVPISVNISRAHFTQEDLAEHICKIVEESGAPKELIELELTESAFFEDKDILINTVEKLKSMGFSISMDDFGAGYSSLNSLKDLQLDVLKIDADFFRGKEENEDRGSLIVSETIHLAKNLGMTTVAEGIESEDQVDFLAKNGCDLIQGFYFAKPMPIEDYILRMDEN